MKNKIENVLYALISNGIISFDRPGTSYPQAAITGYEKLGTRDTTRSNQDTLKFYDPQFDGQGNVTLVKPAEIIIPLPDYWIKPMLKKFKTNNIVLALEMLNEDIKVRPELYQVKGLRIPNQQLSSNDFFQIKEFKLPTMQNYVLVPSEIVVKVGSDYDIDKLNLYWAEDTELKLFGDLSDEEIQDKYDNHVENSKDQGLESIPFEIFKKKYQTKDSKDRELLNLEKQILLNPRNAHHLVMPLTDEIFVKDIYAQMVKEGLITPPEPSYLASYLPTTNVKNAVIFVQGKFAVGIGALGITNKATSQSDSVSVNRFYKNQQGEVKSLRLFFEGLTDNYSLSDYTDNLGTIISETQSQLLTQFVDNVKNPTAVLMGITMQTANVMDYLVRRGVNPQSIIYLINQPLVKLYLAYQKSNESYFNKANNLELSKTELVKELLKNTNYGGTDVLPDVDLDLTLVDSEMKENLLNPKYNRQQLQMLAYFLDLQDQSRAFSDLNASQNSDTKPLKDKQALDEAADIIGRVITSDIVSKEMLGKMFTQGLVAPFYQFGRKMYKIYNPFYALSQSHFGTLLLNFKNAAAKLEKGAGKDRVRQTIENDFVLFLVQNFNMTNEFDKLMVGNNSVARRIQDLKTKLPSNLVLKQFVPMLNNVIDPETGNKVDNIRLFEKELTGFDSQDLAESLKEIAETDVELYKDLVKVLMYQSGLNISPFNYRQIITIGLDTLRDKLSDYEFFYQDLVGNGVKNGLSGLTQTKAKALFEQFVTLFGANNPQFLKKNFFHSENPYSLKKVWNKNTNKFDLKDRKEKPYPQLGTGSTKKYHLASTTKNTVPPEVTKQPNYDNVGDYVDYEDVADGLQKQNLFTVSPTQAADKKAVVKASVATKYVGYGEGIANSSTELYRKQAGKYANTGNYTTNDVVFVSIGGRRGDEQVRKVQQDKTIKEAISAIESGATLITDNKQYVNSSDYNEGEKRLAKNLEFKGYVYSEQTVDGQVLGIWRKDAPQEQLALPEQINLDTQSERYTPSLLMYQDFIKKNQLYTGEEVLPFIGESEYYRYLVPALIKMNPEVKTVFGSNLESTIVDQMINGDQTLDIIGSVIGQLTSTAKGGAIKPINLAAIKSDSTTKTLVHELVHLTIQKEYDKKGEFYNSISELYDIADKYAFDNSLEDYGFRSPTEFLAEALSNPEFMQKLNEIPYKEETVFSYLMRLVSDFINELLGVELNSGSVLAEVINLSEQVLQKNIGEISKNTPVELSSMGQEIVTNFESYFPDYGWMNDAQKYQTVKLVEQGKLTLNCKF